MKAFEPTRYRDPEEPSFFIISKNPILSYRKKFQSNGKSGVFCDFYFFQIAKKLPWWKGNIFATIEKEG